jgi:hypothetical protein
MEEMENGNGNISMIIDIWLGSMAGIYGWGQLAGPSRLKPEFG